MADNQDTPQNPGGVNTNVFTKGMMKDYNESFIGEGMYTHARNAVNNSYDGQVGVIGNEPSNIFCVNLPYTMIGCIHLLEDQWLIFTTDDTNSEIGVFDESDCTYTPLKSPEGNPINFNCLNLKRTNLITGVFRYRFDCDRIVYWDDGLNPSRTLDIDKVPVLKSCTFVANCQICKEVVTNGKATLDCEAVRLAPLVTHPCIKIKKGEVAGTLPNGSYQAAIAYLINGVRVTDYLGLTDVQPIWSHENTNSSLEIRVESIDQDFKEFELVLLTNINAQQVAKKIGTYSSTQGTIYVDRWSTEYVTVSISDIVLRTEPIEKSDAMYNVGDYLIRVGSYSKFKFNYQPLANKITAKWVGVKYPANYYVRGNHNAGYLRDEVYSFFIRFIHNTGEFTESYHIPGRPPLASDTVPVASGGDNIDIITQPYWKVYNTGTVTSTATSSPSYLEGGQIVATGNMGYWESTEKYPGDRPDIWNTNPNIINDPLNLCGKNIRHHKMPDETVGTQLNSFTDNGRSIVLLGVQFSNISFPLDNSSNPITSIVGYEILRGSREGNKSIIAKGLLNNMREYDIPNNSVKGLFQNYPFNDLRSDDYLTSKEQTGENGNSSKPSLTAYKKDYFSFHSPDTTFNNPYLNPYELKLYNLYSGSLEGGFVSAYKHPLEKQLGDTLIGNGFGSVLNTITELLTTLQISSALIGGFDFNVGALTDPTSANVGIQVTSGVGDVLGITSEVLVAGAAAANLAAAIPVYGVPGTGYVTGIIQSIINKLNNFGANINFNPSSLNNIFIGKVLIRTQLIKSFYFVFPKKQFAYQFNSHGFYDTSVLNVKGNMRKKLLRNYYVYPNIQQFDPSYQINNINRSNYVALQTSSTVYDPSQINPAYQEQSRYIRSTEQNSNKKLYSYYGALKLNIPSQYDQLESIKQIPLNTLDEFGTCITSLKPGLIYKTAVLFGGDIYINRFTEKNVMPFFTDWMYDFPDQTEYDYTKYINVPYPKYWVNFREFTGAYVANPSNFRSLDDSSVPLDLYVSKGSFYLFNSGIRDFFVESEVNIAYRDWEEEIPKRHYDTYTFTNYDLLFRSDFVKNPNYYKYDYSLSISKLLNSHITWGNMLERNYDPITANSCYTYVPYKVRYSLPQQSESRRDTWRVFLANNYYDFPSQVSSIKSINKTGALFMMKYQSPVQFTGVEELKLDANTNTKVTIGDGGLFNQALQSAVNVDESYEYGSNQGRYCSVNTTYGLFWISQNQGKVFQYSEGLNDITNGGLKWWFSKYLPSQLLAMYPDYPYGDNPVVGVGVQLIYDNTNEVLYLTKKDYSPKFDSASTLELRDGKFYLPNSNTPIPFTNTQYFEEANFTISYDPKSKTWVSFHDWIPTFLIPGRNHFMSVNTNSIWKHNITCTSYCNYYGVDYPFEVEFVSTTGQQVNSMRSIEYYLEVYNYSNRCRDKFHVLDQNFDQAIIYNSEQVSGLLELNLKAKNNPLAMLTYPQIGPNSIKIQYSKEENKYRFNQFWDITNNRGEYVPNAIPMFNLQPNGYKFNINPAYVNYAKSPLEHKKFRHYVNRVFLRRLVSGNNKFLFKISNEKLLQSYR